MANIGWSQVAWREKLPRPSLTALGSCSLAGEADLFLPLFDCPASAFVDFGSGGGGVLGLVQLVQESLAFGGQHLLLLIQLLQHHEPLSVIREQHSAFALPAPPPARQLNLRCQLIITVSAIIRVKY